MSFWTDLQSNLTPEQLKTLQESARTGGTTTRDGNAETGQMWDNPRDLGGGLYQDQSGGYYGGTKGVTYGYDPQGNYLGQRTNKGLGSQIWGDVGPVAMAAGAYALGPGAGLGGGASDAALTAGDMAIGGGSYAPAAFGDTAALGANQVASMNPYALGAPAGGLTAPSAAYAPASMGGPLSELSTFNTGVAPAAGGGFLNNLLGAGASNYMIPGAILGSSLIGAGAAKSAANTQAAAQQRALDLQAQQYQQQRADLQPFVAAGAGAQNQLLTYLGLPGGTQGPDYGKYTKDFGMSDFVTDPSYAFRLSEGQKALERSAAARGGLLSGGTGKRIADYGQNMASQEYSNAYNRYQTNRANQLNPLFSLTGSGQASATNQAAAAGTYGTQAGQGLTNIGAANAAGTVAGANALGSGLGQYLNYTSNENLANALNTRKTGYA